MKVCRLVARGQFCGKLSGERDRGHFVGREHTNTCIKLQSLFFLSRFHRAPLPHYQNVLRHDVYAFLLPFHRLLRSSTPTERGDVATDFYMVAFFPSAYHHLVLVWGLFCCICVIADLCCCLPNRIGFVHAELMQTQRGRPHPSALFSFFCFTPNGGHMVPCSNRVRACVVIGMCRFRLIRASRTQAKPPHESFRVKGKRI